MEIEKQITLILKKIKKRKKQEIKERWTLIISWFMFLVSLLMLITTRRQTNISKNQTEILSQQTLILSQQTEIQSGQLEFQKDKHWTDTAKDYREGMNNLFDEIYFVEEWVLRDVHKKIMNWEKIQNLSYLDRYVNEWENIWALFCDNKIKIMDLKGILKSPLEKVCGNPQIYYRYQNTRSGISAMCETLFPWSSVMATFADTSKCPILNK